jgi:hypothetical protein
MALTDINYQEGEGQDFIVELPPVSYSGSPKDINIETNSTQFLLLEVPKITGGGNIFIIND